MKTNQIVVAELARLRGPDQFRTTLAALSLQIKDRPEVRYRLLEQGHCIRHRGADRLE
jgi:hypothetical protein